MAKAEDPRKNKGGRVHTKATFVVASEISAQRRYGSKWHEKAVPGIVVDIHIRKSRKGRNQTWVEAYWYLGGGGSIPRNYEVKEILISNVKKGFPDTTVTADLPAEFLSVEQNVVNGSFERPSIPVVEEKSPSPIAGKASAVQGSTVSNNNDKETPHGRVSIARKDIDIIPSTPAKQTVDVSLINGLFCSPLPKQPDRYGNVASSSDEESTDLDHSAGRPTASNNDVVVVDEEREEANENEANEDVASSNFVEVNGIKWYHDDSNIAVDGIGSRPIAFRKWRLISQHDPSVAVSEGSDPHGGLSAFDIFLMLFPQKTLHQIVVFTNAILISKGHQPTTEGEILKFFGVLLLGTFLQFGDRRELWSKRSKNPYLPSPNFGRTGMGRDRFKALFTCIRFSYQPKTKPGSMSHETYRWMLVDDFVAAFNDHRRQFYKPSSKLVCDESFAEWNGLGGSYITVGLPVFISYDRKPHDGCEIQDAADGESGVMLQLKLVKSPDELARLDRENPKAWHSREEIHHGGKILLDLVEPWLDSDRIVYADSYFASKNVATYLDERKTGFGGSVKTATVNYPMSYLSTVECSGKRGESKVLLEKDYEGKPTMMAVMSVDRSRQYYIFSRGSTMPSLVERFRWKQDPNDGREAWAIF